jgi:2-amino-4-hydroxy-6-hydroxymethyldihydropteridine diphosphokinase
MAERTIAYIALGSNLDDPLEQVYRGIEAVAQIPKTELDRCSSLYRTAPVGVTAQPDFINAVCRVFTALSPEQLMRELLALERMRGRVRSSAKGGPRRLDLDLLLYGREQRASSELELPHPSLHERAFVLYPLAELDPRLNIPGRGTVAELAAACRGQRIERVTNVPACEPDRLPDVQSR